LLETPVAAGRRIGTREFFTFSSFEAQNLILRVFGARPDDIAPYELRVVLEESFVCQPDPFDQMNSGDSIEDAVTIGLAPTRSPELTMCSPNDQDFLSVFLLGGFRYETRLQWRRPNTAMSLRVFDADGNAFPDAGQQIGNTFTRGFNFPGAGIAEIILQPQITAGFSTDYTLVIDAFPIVTCTPDPFDPNETPALAEPLMSFPVTATNLSLCPSQRRVDPMTGQDAGGDEDWYSFELEPGERVEAEIRFEQSDLLLELLEGDGVRRACPNRDGQRCFSDGFMDTERVGFTATSTGTYFLRVSSVFSAPGVPLPDDVNARYELDIDVSTP
jgi:hypothetical protein